MVLLRHKGDDFVHFGFVYLIMFNTPKMKLPEKHTEVFKTYKNGTPEEKAEIEGCFIKTVKDEDSEFYSPMLASLNEQQLKSMLRQVLFLIDTGDDNDD